MTFDLLDRARVPASEQTLKLYQRGTEFSLRLDNLELMNSRVHGSEQALAQLACAELGTAEPGSKDVRILVGGLGMGYTLRAVLDRVSKRSRVVVAELVPAVVDWNRDYLGQLAAFPLEDERTTVKQGDVATELRVSSHYDAILLDVDNGPEGLTHDRNGQLYTARGLAAAHSALAPGGVLAVWSAHESSAFRRRLEQLFSVSERRVRARGNKGARHVIWLAKRSG